VDFFRCFSGVDGFFRVRLKRQRGDISDPRAAAHPPLQCISCLKAGVFARVFTGAPLDLLNTGRVTHAAPARAVARRHAVCICWETAATSASRSFPRRRCPGSSSHCTSSTRVPAFDGGLQGVLADGVDGRRLPHVRCPGQHHSLYFVICITSPLVVCPDPHLPPSSRCTDDRPSGPDHTLEIPRISFFRLRHTAFSPIDLPSAEHCTGILTSQKRHPRCSAEPLNHILGPPRWQHLRRTKCRRIVPLHAFASHARTPRWTPRALIVSRPSNDDR